MTTQVIDIKAATAAAMDGLFQFLEAMGFPRGMRWLTDIQFLKGSEYGPVVVFILNVNRDEKKPLIVEIYLGNEEKSWWQRWGIAHAGEGVFAAMVSFAGGVAKILDRRDLPYSVAEEVASSGTPIPESVREYVHAWAGGVA